MRTVFIRITYVLLLIITIERWVYVQSLIELCFVKCLTSIEVTL